MPRSQDRLKCPNCETDKRALVAGQTYLNGDGSIKAGKIEDGIDDRRRFVAKRLDQNRESLEISANQSGEVRDHHQCAVIAQIWNFQCS